MIYVMLAEGFEEIEALAFVDILRRADIAVSTVSINSSKVVKGSHGIEVIADNVIADIDRKQLEAIVLPGGMPGTLNLKASAEVISLIEWASDNDKTIGAICAAPMVLGELNLLNGKRATCFPGFEKYLTGAMVTGDKVSIDGKIITAKGAGAASDFAHAFICKFKDRKTADEIIATMQY